jgi:hypothetical protein
VFAVQLWIIYKITYKVIYKMAESNGKSQWPLGLRCGFWSVNAGILGLSPTQGMVVCPFLFFLTCVGRDLAKGRWSPTKCREKVRKTGRKVSRNGEGSEWPTGVTRKRARIHWK